MTTKEGHLTWAAKRASGMANSVEANKRRRRREPTVIDWDERIANLLDILDDSPAPTAPNPVAAQALVTSRPGGKRNQRAPIPARV